MNDADGQARAAWRDRLPLTAGARPPRRLWWMYLLIMLALAVMGAGAAQAWVSTHDLGLMSATVRCEHDLGAVGPWSANAPASAPLQACAAPFDFRQGIAMPAGAAAMLGSAWLLMLGGGLWSRWRLRRSRAEAAPTAAARQAAERFGQWCDAWNLAGRRRPVLRLAAPGRSAGQAFTTGLPFGRPLVVVPLSYAYADPADFDVVVLHELAHVRSRDLTWASSAWWAGWLILPALLLAVGPIPGRFPLLWAGYQPSLWLAGGLSLAALALRAALLRQRELAADRHASDVLGGTAALHAALGGGDRPAGARGSAARRRAGLLIRTLAASHPSRAARLRAGSGPAGLRDGGFAVSAAAGLLTMFTFQQATFAASDIRDRPFDQSWLTFGIISATVSLLWAALVIPAWARRAEAAARAGARPRLWWPAAGTAAGLTAGWCLKVPGAATAVNLMSLTGHVPLVVAVLTVVTAGIGVLAAGCAAAAGGGGRPPHAVAGAVLAASAALTAALSMLITLLIDHVQYASAALDRESLLAMGFINYWRFAPLLVLIGGALAGSASAVGEGGAGQPGPERRWRVPVRLPLRACLPVIIAATAAGTIAGALSWQARIGSASSADTVVTLFDQRSWICALAGWAAMTVILLAGRAAADRSGREPPWADVPTALSAGLLTAAAAGLAVFAIASIAGFGDKLGASLQAPMWLLLVAAVVTVPWLLLAAALAGRTRRRPVAAAGRLPVIAGSSLLSGALSVALLGGVLAPLTISTSDYHRYLAVRSRSQPPAQPVVSMPEALAPVRLAPAGADPGRPLSTAAAIGALDSIRGRLGTGWTVRIAVAAAPRASGPAVPPGTRPRRCEVMLDRDAAAVAAQPSTAAATGSFRHPAPGTMEGIWLRVSVTSYVTPVPNFDGERKEVARCPRYQEPSSRADNHRLDMSISADAPPDLPYRSYRLNSVLRFSVNTMPGAVIDLTDSALVGHNLAAAEVTYSYDFRPPSAAVRGYSAQLARAALAMIIQELGARPAS